MSDIFCVLVGNMVNVYEGPRLVVACWADFVEANRVREPSHYDGRR